jgi:hypothetical protein
MVSDHIVLDFGSVEDLNLISLRIINIDFDIDLPLSVARQERLGSFIASLRELRTLHLSPEPLKIPVYHSFIGHTAIQIRSAWEIKQSHFLKVLSEDPSVPTFCFCPKLQTIILNDIQVDQYLVNIPIPDANRLSHEDFT